MITQIITKGEGKREGKIEITRLKEMNIVNNGLLKPSKRLAKAYNITE